MAALCTRTALRELGWRVVGCLTHPTRLNRVVRRCRSRVATVQLVRFKLNEGLEGELRDKRGSLLRA